MMKTTKKIFLMLIGILPVMGINLMPNIDVLANFINLSIQAANAESKGLYLPPVTRNPRSSQGSGSRGCEQYFLNKNDLIELLIPSTEYAAQTGSSHPSFYYYLSEAVSVPMVFSLVKQGQTEPIMVTTISNQQAGIVRVTMPKSAPGLKTGEIYKWSVSLVCNQKRPSANPLFYSWIEKVDIDPELITGDSYTQAKIYGELGLWYDYLAALEQAHTENPNNPLITADFQAIF